jgi:phage protein D
MRTIAAAISINDQPKPELLAALLELEIEGHHAESSVFRLRAATTKADQGLWRFLDDEQIQPWARVAITVTLGEEEHELLSGFLTEIRARIEAEEGGSHVELIGMDATALMGLEEKLRDWANKKDSDIASAIFAEYGLTARVDDTEVIHDEAISTIIQRDTDIRFLRRLAERNGFDCVVRGSEGFFGAPILDGDALPILAAHFGAETNLTAFQARWDLQRAAAYQVSGIDAAAKQIDVVDVDTGTQTQLGRERAPGAAPPNGLKAKALARPLVTTGRPELERVCQALVHEGEWFIDAKGDVDGATYGAVLEPGRLVPIKGVGAAFSGLYFITSVKHLFTSDRYEQHFTARRNAAFSEESDFGGGGGLPL